MLIINSIHFKYGGSESFIFSDISSRPLVSSPLFRSTINDSGDIGRLSPEDKIFALSKCIRI